MSNKNGIAWGLLRRRQATLPTWRGWIVILVLVGLIGLGGLRCSYSFLAVNDPSPSGILVVEGWASDYVLAAAKEEFTQHRYLKLCVTGGPIEAGAPLCEYRTYAERGVAVLLKLGLSTNEVSAVPAPLVRQDRTYTCARTLRQWLATNNIAATNINLISVGPHSRRSRLLFQKAFGNEVPVGIMSIPSQEYDPGRWWHSSAGFRAVTSEQIAYTYARFFFHPGKQPAL